MQCFSPSFSSHCLTLVSAGNCNSTQNRTLTGLRLPVFRGPALLMDAFQTLEPWHHADLGTRMWICNMGGQFCVAWKAAGFFAQFEWYLNMWCWPICQGRLLHRIVAITLLTYLKRTQVVHAFIDSNLIRTSVKHGNCSMLPVAPSIQARKPWWVPVEQTSQDRVYDRASGSQKLVWENTLLQFQVRVMISALWLCSGLAVRSFENIAPKNKRC